MKIPFEYIDDVNISVARKKLVNGSSGLVRHLTDEQGIIAYPNGSRIIDGKLVTDSEDKRIFHEDYDKHMVRLGIKDKQGQILCPAYVNGLRDLFQNPWHIFFENHSELEQYLADGKISSTPRLADRFMGVKEDKEYGITKNGDLSTGRIYSCLVAPKKGNPYIKQLRFDNYNAYDKNLEENLTDSIKWAASGKSLIRNGEALKLEEIVKEYYDVAHFLPVSERLPEYVKGVSDRLRKKSDLLKFAYTNHPGDFEKNCIQAIKEGYATAEYYFDIVGVDDNSLMILHDYGTLKDVARKGLVKGMNDAIIVDEGGSVATWSSFEGYENKSSYFRPEAISLLGIKLKQDAGKNGN